VGSISTSRSERATFHPFAWWGWALALTVALFIASDPFYAAGVTLASAVVVRRFRSDHPWSKSFATAMRLVVVIVTIRLAIAVVIGVPIPGTTLVTLPTLVTPEWIAGIRIGGPVTVERVSTTFSEVMIIVGVIALIAAATSLTSPHRLIRSIPFAFYQLTLILTVATSVFPQLVTSIKRIQMARRLRGQAPGGLRNWRKIAMPLLEESLERSLDLAAAMESRGFGQRIRRTRYRPDKWRRLDTLLLLTAATSVLLLSLANSSSMSLVAGIFAAGMVAKPR
jgi:energy-coupling factor transport system permease protein